MTTGTEVKCRPCWDGRHNLGWRGNCPCCPGHEVSPNPQLYDPTPVPVAAAYPACLPCHEARHREGLGQPCACCWRHTEKPCPGCDSILVLDPGGGPYHPTLFCAVCGHTDMSDAACREYACQACAADHLDYDDEEEF